MLLPAGMTRRWPRCRRAGKSDAGCDVLLHAIASFVVARHGPAVGRPATASRHWWRPAANLSDEPICTDEAKRSRLGTHRRPVLVHDRPIEAPWTTAWPWIVDGEPRLLRRARFAPAGAAARRPVIRAVGASQEHGRAGRRPPCLHISQHIGDLETPIAGRLRTRHRRLPTALYEAEPVVIAHDMHQSICPRTKGAERRKGGETGSGKSTSSDAKQTDSRNRLARFSSFFPPFPHCFPVQHHHAHLAACLAEHGADGAS